MQIASFVRLCHLWPVRLDHIFPHYLTNGTIFGRNVLNIKCMFWFPLQLLSETFLILRRIKRDIIIYVHRSSCQVTVILVRFYSTWISPQILGKYPNIKFHQNPSSGSRVVPCGQTEITTLFAILRTRLTNGHDQRCYHDTEKCLVLYSARAWCSNLGQCFQR